MERHCNSVYIYIYCTLAYISKSQIILSQLNCLNWPFRNHNANLVLYPCLSFSYLYTDVYVYIHMCIYICVYIYIYNVCMYVYMYIYTHIYTIRERSFGMILVLLLQITWARTLLSNFDYCFSSYNSTVLPMFHCRYLICFTCVLTVFN